MALYIPAGKRRRRLALLVAAGLVVGLVVGLLVGRATAPDLGDGVASARAKASDVIDLLDSLPVEYQATQAGAAGKSQATFNHSLDELNAKLDAAIAKASWFGSGAVERLRAAIASVRAADKAGVAPAAFEHTVTAAGTVVRDEFGVPTG